MSENRITTRFDEETDNQIAAAAERCDLSKAEWMRNAALAALAMETSAARDPLSFVELSDQARDLHASLGQIETISNEINQDIDDLSRTIAMERAADRFMNEQILRIAVRAAHAAITVASNRGFDDEQDVFKLLCDEADDSFREGVEFVEKGMKQARHDMAQTLALRATS